MALILAFRAAEAAPASAPASRRAAGPEASPAHCAELIIFPGVRYQRHASDPAFEPVSNGRRTRRTKPRELIDLME